MLVTTYFVDLILPLMENYELPGHCIFSTAVTETD